MLTNKEIRNKLFFKNLGRFIMEDPLGACSPVYDDDGEDFAIGHIDKDSEIFKTGTNDGQGKLRVTVPLYEFESIKQYTDMFVKTAKKAVEHTGNVHEYDWTTNLTEFCDKLYTNLPNSWCAGILGSGDIAWKVDHQLKKENSHIRMPIQKDIDIEPDMIYCFPESNYSGVCPELYNYNKELKKVNGPIKLGLMIIASSVHAIKLT